MSLYKKYQETIKRWEGKRVDYDWYYNNQCVDWIRQYAVDIWYPITTYGHARTFAIIWLWKNWKRVYWDPWVWDIIVQPRGTYWHIAVVYKISWDTIWVHEQNRDGQAYKNNNSKNLWSPVSLGKYIITGDEVYYRAFSNDILAMPPPPKPIKNRIK